MNIEDAKIVVFGGGTGSNIILSGLTEHTENVTAVVCMSDDGGSTGVLRRQYGVLPPGDVRKSVSAMAAKDSKDAEVFEYRFDQGDLSGHTVGNVFLTAYELITGSMTEAVKAMSSLLDIRGQVLPVTDSSTDLMYKKPGGEVVKGEINISYRDFEGDKNPEVYLSDNPKITPEVRQAIVEADLLVIAPGLLYGSLAPVLMVSGLSDAISESKGQLVCVSNIVAQLGTDPKQSVDGYVSEVERLLGLKVEHVFVNTDLDDASADGQLIVPEYDMGSHYGVTLGQYRDRDQVDVSDTTDVPRVSTRHSVEVIAADIVTFIRGIK